MSVKGAAIRAITEQKEKYREKKQRYDQMYMDIAERVSQMSYGRRAKVGAIVVKDGRIISMGWNGTPSGDDNNCEDEKVETMYVDPHPKSKDDVLNAYYQEDVDDLLNEGWKILDFETGLLERRSLITKPSVLHAELNAIAKLAASHESAEGATVYVTLSPCVECAKIMKQAKVARVVYRDKYRITDGIDFLESRNVEVEQL